MAAKANKTVRFARVVTRSGRPKVHTQWISLGKDPELKRALAAHRVMAIDSARGKTDVGHVAKGSLPKGGGRYLLFPKSLKSFEHARVVGIKFDLVEQGELVPARKTAHAPRKRKAMRNAKPPAVPSILPVDEKTPVRAARGLVRGSVAKPPAQRRRRQADDAAEPKRVAQVKATSDGEVRREARAALRLLKAGKTVAAYQRLERAVAGE